MNAAIVDSTARSTRLPGGFDPGGCQTAAPLPGRVSLSRSTTCLSNHSANAGTYECLATGQQDADFEDRATSHHFTEPTWPRWNSEGNFRARGHLEQNMVFDQGIPPDAG
jgi:hypothetical protein